MATKRPENPYDGFISALFKDASNAIKDTSKKTRPVGEDAPNNPDAPDALEDAVSSITLDIIPSIIPSITQAHDEKKKSSSIRILEKQTRDHTEGHTRGHTKDQTKAPTVVRSLDVLPNKTSSAVDNKKTAGAPEAPSSTDGDDGPGGAKVKVKDRARHHTEYHTPSGFEIYPLTDFQRKVLVFLIEKEKKVTAMREIAVHTGISYNSIRKILKVLFSNGLIVKDKAKYVSGKFQGFRYTVSDHACKKALQRQIEYQAGYRVEGETLEECPAPLEAGDASAMVQHLVANMADIYPNLHGVGLRRKDITDIVQCWKAQSYDLTKLADSFEAADWDLAHNDGRIQTPATYVRKALKSGPYTFPKGFKSRRQIQVEQEAQIAEECRKHLEKMMDDCFHIWWNGMTSEERKGIDGEIGKTNRLMPSLGDTQKRILRQEWFRENAYSSALKEKLFSQTLASNKS